MRAIIIKEYGGPEVLAIEDIDPPEPRPGHVLIEVKAFGHVANAWTKSLTLTLKASGVHDLMGSITANLRKKCVVNVGMPGARPGHELFIPSLPPAELQSWGLYPKSR